MLIDPQNRVGQPHGLSAVAQTGATLQANGHWSNGSEAVDAIDAILTAASFASPPKIALRLLDLCAGPTAGAGEIANVIRTDPSLSAKLIRLANTVHYGAGIAATSVQAATVRLGTDKIKSVALAFEIAGLAREAAGDHFDFESYWQGCVARACVARAIAMRRHSRIGGEAFLVGLLQDLGMPILAEHAPAAYGEVLRESGGCQLRLAALESKVFHFNHIHVVARLFQRWKMPTLLTDAIGRHHTRPPMHRATAPALRLWQIAYLVGALPIRDEREQTFYDASLPAVLHAAFGIAGSAKAELFGQAKQEFHDIEDMFRPYIGRTVRAADLMARAADILGAAESTAVSVSAPADEGGVVHRSPTPRLRPVPAPAMSRALDTP